MQIEILLDPKAPDYSDFIDDLHNELRELKGLEYKQVEAPAPPRTLNVTHDVIKLIFTHGADAMKLVTALLQLGSAVAERVRGAKSKSEGPSTSTAVLKVDDRTLAFPAPDGKQRGFLSAVRHGKTKRVTKKSVKPKKPRPGKKKRR